MWKFKASKYKNCAPKFPKKEQWITDISANNLLHSCGNHISASSAYVVFNTDASAPGNLGILPLDSTGRHHSSTIKHICAHAEYVTDFDFSPFDDYLLSTCSHDQTVNIWHLPEELNGDVGTSEWTLTMDDKHVENVLWHPTVAAILAVTCGTTLKVYDVSVKQCKYEIPDHGDLIQSMSWKGDGSMVATSCKDMKVRIIDPRTQAVVQEADGHQNIRDSRVLWMGNRDMLLSSGFSKNRDREVKLYDTRQLSTCLNTLKMSSSMGTLMPFYDADTNMIFLAGKGDAQIRYLELTDKNPYFLENSIDTVDQVKGMCMLPKRALDVMSGEVNRLLVLTKNAVVPAPYIVPRKSYTEFHADIFPDTFSCEPTLTVEQWCQGETKLGNKISLDPSKKQVQIILRRNIEDLDSCCDIQLTKPPPPTTIPKKLETDTPKDTNSNETAIINSHVTSTSSVQNNQAAKTPQKPEPPKPEIPQSKPQPPVNPAILREKKQHKVFSGVRQSKFRHLEGSTEHKGQNIENVQNLSQTIPGESDMFQANAKYCAVPMAGPGGGIAIHKTTEPCRLPVSDIPTLQNHSPVMDFVFDPFNESRLVVACDDAKIRVWDIPEGGVTETLSNPQIVLHGHQEKIYFVRYHPLAKDVLASASYDMTVRIWDLTTTKQVIELHGHTDTIFCFDWSSNGKYCATACKDGKLRVFEPRKSQTAIKEGVGPEGTRGARVKWVCDDKYLIVSGFTSMSQRSVWIYSAEDLVNPLYSVEIDTAPAILIPYYDQDTATLFLTGRGDGLIRALEVADEYPHLFLLSDYKTMGLHQGLSFLTKQHLNVQNVEFARAFRLTPHSIEPISFKVPRVKTEYFQEDVFPDTKVTWEPVLSSSEWFSGANGTQRTISLKPANMKKLSEAPVEAPKAKKYESFQDYQQHYKTDAEKKEELLAAMNTKLDLQHDPLPQDLAEGVDEDEWDD